MYACNAIYREYDPDYLIAVDVKMIQEIVATEYHTTHQVWTNPNKGVKHIEHLNFFTTHKGWSSGPTALYFASTSEYKEIYIFGFDYQGIDGKFNNVYADSTNYKKSTDPSTYFGNWLRQTHDVLIKFNHIQYYRVTPLNSFIPDIFKKVDNLTHITYDEFSKKYSECI